MRESTATIKLTRSEIEWNIIALVWMEKSSDEFRRPQDAKMFKKLKEDFINIKEAMIEGESLAREKNKPYPKKEYINKITGEKST